MNYQNELLQRVSLAEPNHSDQFKRRWRRKMDHKVRRKSTSALLNSAIKGELSASSEPLGNKFKQLLRCKEVHLKVLRLKEVS